MQKTLRKLLILISLSSFISILFTSCTHERSEFDKGYDLGMSDTAKRQYWAIQKVQEMKDNSRAQKANYRNVIIPVYGKNQDGTNIAPHYVNVRVIDQ